jgi:hypothetical protein
MFNANHDMQVASTLPDIFEADSATISNGGRIFLEGQQQLPF